jgi:hypothetical protein
MQAGFLTKGWEQRLCKFKNNCNDIMQSFTRNKSNPCKFNSDKHISTLYLFDHPLASRLIASVGNHHNTTIKLKKNMKKLIHTNIKLSHDITTLTLIIQFWVMIDDYLNSLKVSLMEASGLCMTSSAPTMLLLTECLMENQTIVLASLPKTKATTQFSTWYVPELMTSNSTTFPLKLWKMITTLQIAL